MNAPERVTYWSSAAAILVEVDREEADNLLRDLRAILDAAGISERAVQLSGSPTAVMYRELIAALAREV